MIDSMQIKTTTTLIAKIDAPPIEADHMRMPLRRRMGPVEVHNGEAISGVSPALSRWRYPRFQEATERIRRCSSSMANVNGVPRSGAAVDNANDANRTGYNG